MAKKKITEATPEQWQQIEELKERWIASQTHQYTDVEIREVVNRMWASMDLPEPVTLVAPSPFAMVQWAAAIKQLASPETGDNGQKKPETLADQPWYVGYWWRAWSGWYAGAKILGVEFDEEKLSLFTDWADRVTCWCAYKGLIVVSRNPTQIHWQDGELHCETGPAVLYADGWGHYALTGVAVDEQIVMRPETQTIEQIREEDNEEVKRIRIERFGWEKYLGAVGAKVIHERRNDVDGTHEGLFELEDDMRAFVGRCRSTGRVYFLEVPPEIETCEQAQKWLTGDKAGNCIGAS